MIKANELRIGNWVRIKKFSEYSISENGEVYSHRRNKMMKVWSVKDKYPRVTISINGKGKSFTIHRLVAEHFIPNPLNKLTVNHKDGNKQNNHVSNLEWCTLSENCLHAVKIGLIEPPTFGFGEMHQASKLTNVDIEMIKILLDHDFTLKQIAERFNVHPTHISNIKLKKTRKNG